MHEIEGFSGRSALVTGAADGIGLALSDALVSAGARVFMSDVAADKLAANAKRLGAASAPCDVTEAEAMEALVERAWSELHGIDLLCANAGVFTAGSVLEAGREEIDWIFGVNVWGIVNACRPFVRLFRAAHDRAAHGAGDASSEASASILMTGSEHSLSNPSYLRHVPLHLYNMTKHSVLSLGESLRAELEADGIGISVLCPGPVVSGLTENSGRFRPARFGGPTEIDLGDAIDEAQAKRLAELYMPAARAAEIALTGVARGAFVIPTHAFQREDVEARQRDIAAGFELIDAEPA